MLIIDPQERLVIEGRLKEAKHALHELQMGRSARVLVDQNGERVEFTPTTVTRLVSYIKSLESQLGIGAGSGPMGFVW